MAVGTYMLVALFQFTEYRLYIVICGLAIAIASYVTTLLKNYAMHGSNFLSVLD